MQGEHRGVALGLGDGEPAAVEGFLVGGPGQARDPSPGLPRLGNWARNATRPVGHRRVEVAAEVGEVEEGRRGAELLAQEQDRRLRREQQSALSARI